MPIRGPRIPPTKSKVQCTPKGKDPPPPRITGVRGTREAKVPMRGSRTNLYSVRRAAPWPWAHATRRNPLRKGGPTSTNTEIQECFHRIRPFYVARTYPMMRRNRSMESALMIKIQPHHTFLIRLALATMLPLIDQSAYPFEEFDPSYFQTPPYSQKQWTRIPE